MDKQDSSLEIFVETPIMHTESAEKVAEAITKILGALGKVVIEEDRVTCSSNELESLRFVKDQFRDRRVRSAARRLLLQNSTDVQTQILLNKQAATVAIAALCDDPSESPLGPIVVRVRSSNLKEVIDWLTQGVDEDADSLERSKTI